MANVQKNSQIRRDGIHSNIDIGISSRAEFPRDDLRGDFAGDENKGPADSPKGKSHSTNVKSRMTEKSKAKEPIR